MGYTGKHKTKGKMQEGSTIKETECDQEFDWRKEIFSRTLRTLKKTTPVKTVKNHWILS